MCFWIKLDRSRLDGLVTTLYYRHKKSAILNLLYQFRGEIHFGVGVTTDFQEQHNTQG